MVTIGRLVRAESALDAEWAAFMLLPAEHREAAILSRCEPEPFAPPIVMPDGTPLPQGWNVNFDLPTFDAPVAIAESAARAVEDMLADPPEAA